jgi:D-glycero-alpha-D-manno-heptose-7-phosphate kinase
LEEGHGATIISFAINRYIYLTWNPRPTGGCHLGYSQVEELDTLKDAQHTLVREAAQRYGIEEPCTLTIVSDVPKGTGLGSSSALAVCLSCLSDPSLKTAASVSKAAEIEHAHSKAGWQDYLPATCGGFRYYSFHHGGAFTTRLLGAHAHEIIGLYGLLLYTGASRPADSVLGSWQKSDAQLHEIKALADEMAGRIDDIAPEALGAALSETWRMKRSIPGVTSPALNEQFALAIANGALGGKICGAGAGGCWFFLVPPISTVRARIVNALGLREIPFKIAEKGVETWEL